MNFTYTCGYCGSGVTSERGMSLNTKDEFDRMGNFLGQGVYICPNCKYPTFIYEDMQVREIIMGTLLNMFQKKLKMFTMKPENHFL